MAQIRQIIWNYSLGLGGGSSRAATASLKPVRAWEPSQKGLLADWPQRQSEMTVRPASPKAAPAGSRISKAPSIRMGPLLKTETLVGISDGSTGWGKRIARGCLTVLGDTARRSVSRGANPGTDSQFPANCAGNLVDRKSTRLNSSHRCISYAVFCLK